MDSYLTKCCLLNIVPQLKDLGFDKLKSKLFMKEITDDIKFYVDYRDVERKIYAYNVDRRINPRIFKEYDVIVRIEKYMLDQENKSTLLGYGNA